MEYFDSTAQYVTSATTRNQQITMLESVINALFTMSLTVAEGGTVHIQDYSLNDGQTNVRANYRSLSEITQAINNYTRIKNQLIRDRNGAVIRLVDSGSFI